MSHSRLTAILDHLPMAILLLDAGGTILFATQPLYTMLGFEGRQLIATDAFAHLPGPSSLKHAYECYICRPGARTERILPIRRRNGTAFHANITLDNLLYVPSISAVLATVHPV